MSATTAPAVERVRVPASPMRSYQQAALVAWRAGHRNLILRWARQTGKGVTALAILACAAMERVGAYVFVSPTYGMSYRNVWAGVMASGCRYVDAILPPQLVQQRLENEQALLLVNGSVIRFLSGDQPDRLRGLAILGAVADEFASWDTDEALRVMRPSLAASGGFLVVTSTPRGLNFYRDLWETATHSPDWWCSTVTADDARRDAEGEGGTLVIPPEEIEREISEGTSRAWIDQEYRVMFSAALQGSIYGEDVTRAQREGRIADIPHDPALLTQVGLDLGLTGAAVIAQSSPRGTWINVLWAWKWDRRTLPEVITAVRALPYGVGHWIGPHDLEQGSDQTGEDRLTMARRLGVTFTVVPRVKRIEERIDLVCRRFPKLRFDARGTAPLLESLQHYRRRWNDKLKTFDAEPVHDQHSHLADAFGTLLSGYRERRDAREHDPRPKSRINFNPLDASTWGSGRSR
jgi:hypothetical protein